jgi:thioredoxin-related protein
MLRYITALIIVFTGFVAGGEGHWFTDYKRGIDTARQEKKSMIIYFYSDHCPYCYQMEEFVLGDPEVDKVIRENYVFVSISVDEIPHDVDKKFNPIGTPLFVFYDPSSDRVLLEVFGSRERDDFLNLLIRVCQKSKTNLRRC